jgi:hypothetical protein
MTRNQCGDTLPREAVGAIPYFVGFGHRWLPTGSYSFTVGYPAEVHPFQPPSMDNTLV